MIVEQPHSIQITTSDLNKLASLLIEHRTDSEIIQSIEFLTNVRSEKDSLIALTKRPLEFYKLLNDIIVDNKIPISELRATDEGLEALFKSLTVG